MTRFALPKRAAAVVQSMKFEPGRVVRIYAEDMGMYGPLRNTFAYEARVIRRDVLSGSTMLTGRLIVETATVCHYQKSAVRNGTKVYQTAQGKRRTLVVWPWDIAD
jgi:hypothetical protein